MPSPYDVLGISRDAGDEEIKQAYRERVLESHPDHGGSRAEFKQVRQAYEQITHPEQRENKSYFTKDNFKNNTAESIHPEIAHVEYLNYEILDDYGWSINDESLFDKASEADLHPDDYGRIAVTKDETLLEAAENRGFIWPYSCRGGACANCAVLVVDGRMDIPVSNILPKSLQEQGFRLSCVGAPITQDMKVIYNVKYIDVLEELRLPPRHFDE